MKSTIFVIHCAHGDETGQVAQVTTEGNSINEELEFAYRWTQNIHDSWSMGGEQDGNPAVKRLAPLVQGHDGKEYGLRSTMVGDRMIHNGTVYVVANAGFHKAIDQGWIC